MSMTTAPYRRSSADDKARVIFEIPKDELAAVDAWGVPAGMKSRTAAVRALIKKGLEAVGTADGRSEKCA